jgi:hypothetical protein
LDLKFTVFQGLYQALNDGKAPCDIGLVGCSNFETSVGLEFVRTLAECLSQTFTKLELGFALRGIAIGESLLADVIDGGDNLLKLGNSSRDLLEWSRF